MKQCILIIVFCYHVDDRDLYDDMLKASFRLFIEPIIV
jgi:hypothetical protein